MIDPQKLIRRHDRIRAVWQRTASANTAERCRFRMASIARESREDFECPNTATLPLPVSTARPEDLENTTLSHAGTSARKQDGAATGVGSGNSSAARDKWVADCVAYMVNIGIDRDLAISEAEAWIEDNPEDVTECPKALADDIMSYWVD